MSEEPKRVRRLRLDLIKQIPRFPNDRQTLEGLESRSLGSLLIVWNNWVGRLIPPRARSIKIEPTLTADPRWKRLSADTKLLLKKIKEGSDLTPHVSKSVMRNGYAPAAGLPGPGIDRWQDKDFLLTVMGYHHLHLSPVSDADGFAKRTDEVLFGEVTRTTFTAVGFFDHTVFDRAHASHTKMSVERTRLWEIHDARAARGIAPGSVYISRPITTSGHSVHLVKLAGDLSWIIYNIDAKLDDLKLRSEVFPYLPYSQLRAMKLRWFMNYMDLGLLDKATGIFHVLRYGPT